MHIQLFIFQVEFSLLLLIYLGYLKNRYMGSIIGRVADHISMHFGNIIYPPTISEMKKDHLNDDTIAFDNVNWHSQIINNQVVGCNLFYIKLLF